MALFIAGLVIGAIAGGTLAALVVCCCQVAGGENDKAEQDAAPFKPLVLTDPRNVVHFGARDEIVFFDELVDTEKVEESIYDGLACEIGRKLLHYGALEKRDNGPLTPGKRFDCGVDVRVVMPDKVHTRYGWHGEV